MQPKKVIVRLSLAVALGLGAGMLAGKAAAPALASKEAYFAAWCMGWRPSLGQIPLKRDAPVMLDESAYSFRFTSVTPVGTCPSRWTRKILRSSVLGEGEEALVLDGPRGATYTVVRIGEDRGTRRYMGLIRLSSRSSGPPCKRDLIRRTKDCKT